MTDKPFRKVAAVVPLRGGSKSIPLKNIKPIAGKPLCAWTLEALLGASCVDEVWVSTDSEQIADVVKTISPEIRILMRPDEFATDTASTESVMLHFASQVDFDLLVTVQATSPLLRSEHIDDAFGKFVQNSNDSMLTGVKTLRFFWNFDGTPLNYDPLNRPRRQDFAGTLMENGAFYFTRREVLEKHRCRLGGNIGVYEMPPDTAAELDEKEDWIEIENLLRSRQLAGGETPRIRAIVCDVDGTLTDGGMYYDKDGEALKKFNTRDAFGLVRLRQAGIETWIMTGEDSAVVKARMKKLGITDAWYGISDKLTLLKKICAEKQFSLKELAYIGDDLNDLACLGAVGLPACPADAAPDVLSCCQWVSSRKGGDGAVRELCEWLLTNVSRPDEK